ncbi:MAG: exo-beta-N-acetylmuramidase NamZ domain-containing protein [Bacteroidales bacterium]
MRRILLILSVFYATGLSLTAKAQETEVLQINRRIIKPKDVKTGAERTELYLGKLKDKKVAIMANHTSVIGKSHLVDSLQKLGVNIVCIFSPEHGFRGQGEAGEAMKGGFDEKTGIRVISLYGKHIKPSPEDMKNIDVVVFDIQDVGVRFYTYASSMQYLMEACAEKQIGLIILDRPNPNGYYIDGPVLETKYRSFVGLNPVPLVHGLTLGEYASMINGEGWLQGSVKCDLTVIPVFNYNHAYLYQVPLPPSPNLPNMSSVYLYPSLGLFEGTIVSVGRGTDKPFQIIGFPGMKEGSAEFKPVSKPGFSSNPPYKDQICKGHDLSEFGENYLRDAGRLYLFWIMELYKQYPAKRKFFNSFFEKLAGTATLSKQIRENKTEEEIRNSWQPQLSQYKKIRKKYLLYPDFE